MPMLSDISVDFPVGSKYMGKNYKSIREVDHKALTDLQECVPSIRDQSDLQCVAWSIVDPGEIEISIDQ